MHGANRCYNCVCDAEYLAETTSYLPPCIIALQQTNILYLPAAVRRYMYMSAHHVCVFSAHAAFFCRFVANRMSVYSHIPGAVHIHSSPVAGASRSSPVIGALHSSQWQVHHTLPSGRCITLFPPAGASHSSPAAGASRAELLCLSFINPAAYVKAMLRVYLLLSTLVNIPVCYKTMAFNFISNVCGVKGMTNIIQIFGF